MPVKRKDLFDNGCNLLQEQRDIYKDMRKVAKSVSEGYNLSLKNVMALKEYYHYKGYDWERDPFVPDPDAKFKDRMVVPFRKVLEIIDNLRNSGNLDMLDPVIKALEERGIHLSVDDSVKYEHRDEVMSMVNMMSSYQSEICDLADEREDNREISKELLDSTITSYNQYVATLTSYKDACAKGKEKMAEKLHEKLQKMMLNNGIDQNVYLMLDADMKEVK